MFACRVESGIDPSRVSKRRLISAPPSRPATWIRIPFAPFCIADSQRCLRARRKFERFFICSETVSAIIGLTLAMGFKTALLIRGAARFVGFRAVFVFIGVSLLMGSGAAEGGAL